MIQISIDIPVSTAVASAKSPYGEGCNAVIQVVFQHWTNLSKDQKFQSELAQFKNHLIHQVDHRHLGFESSSSKVTGLWQILDTTKRCLEGKRILSAYAHFIQVTSSTNVSVSSTLRL